MKKNLFCEDLIGLAEVIFGHGVAATVSVQVCVFVYRRERERCVCVCMCMCESVYLLRSFTFSSEKIEIVREK